MGRKRHVLLDQTDLDSDSDCSEDLDQFNTNDPDLQHEESLFNDPYNRKKKKKTNNLNNEAIYGIFSAEDQDLDTRRNLDKALHRNQVFVKASGSAVPHPPDGDSEMDLTKEEDGSDKKSVSDQDSDSDQDSRSDQDSDSEGGEPETTETHIHPDQVFPSTPGSSASNNDFRAMLGSKNQSAPSLGSTANRSITHLEVQSSNQNPTESKTRRSFLGAQESENKSVEFVKKKPLSRVEQQHFAKLAKDSSSSVGLKMLQKMGWKTGTGLGTQAEGIVTPLETKLRPKGMGLSYKGFEERTNQAKEEDRRNGKTVDDDDQKVGFSKKIKEKSSNFSEAWKVNPKSKKNKPVHRTYEQIISELNPDQKALVDPGVGEIIDLTGRKLPSLNTTLTHHSKGPTQEEDEHRLPELLHNLSLICGICKGNLIHLANESSSIKAKFQQLSQDRQKSERIIQIQQEKLNHDKKLVQLIQLTKSISLNINSSIHLNSSAVEICEMMDQFDQVFDDLIDLSPYQNQTGSGFEFENLKRDEIIIGALAPILRRAWDRWDVLNQPNLSVQILKRYRRCLLGQNRKERNNNAEHGKQDETIFQHAIFPSRQLEEKTGTNSKKMTAYEGLIWNEWLPKIRYAINKNDHFQIYHQSEELIEMYKSWNSILPQFVKDNFLDQLILPKLLKSIEGWHAGLEKRDKINSDGEVELKSNNRISLHLFVFPWLELMGPYRTELILEEVKRTVSIWLKSHWKIRSTPLQLDDESFMKSTTEKEDKLIIKDLLIWKNEVFNRRDWDKIILKSLKPNLLNYLRLKLIINPKNQNLEPFQVLLNWSQLISNFEILNEILIDEFFEKWIETLWIWLTSPTANVDQIGEWFRWWKSLFPELLYMNPQSILSWAFGIGQELMNKAKSLSSLGVDMKTQLDKPDMTQFPRLSASSTTSSKTKLKRKGKEGSSKLLEEITFKSIIQEEVEKMNLFLIPIGKNLDSNGKSIFRVSNQFNSNKNSISIYIDDDVVYVKNQSKNSHDDSETDLNQRDQWEPMLLEDMLQKALNVANN